MLVIYLAKYFTNKPVKRQEFSIGKKPVAKEEPGVASDSEDSDSDVESVVESDSDSDRESVAEPSTGAESVVKKLIEENSLLPPPHNPSSAVATTMPPIPPSQTSSPKSEDSNRPFVIPQKNKDTAAVSPPSPVTSSLISLELPSTSSSKNAETSTSTPVSPSPSALSPKSGVSSPTSPKSTTSQTSSRTASSSQTAVTSTSTSQEVLPQKSAQRSNSDSDSDSNPYDKVLGINKNNKPKPSSPKPQDDTIEICEKCDKQHKTDDCPYFKEKRENEHQPLAEEEKASYEKIIQDYADRVATQDGEWGNGVCLTAFVRSNKDVTVIVHKEGTKGEWSSRKIPDTENWREKVIHIKHVVGKNSPCDDNCNHYILLKPKQNFEEGQSTFKKENFEEFYTIDNGSCMFDAITEGLKDPDNYENHSKDNAQARKKAYFETRKNISKAIKPFYDSKKDCEKTILINAIRPTNT
jgi:hypothetical protein